MSNPFTERPTATIGTIATATGTVLAELVATHVIPEHLAKVAGPWVTLVVIGGFFAWTWLHVSPAKKLKALLEQIEGGRIPDADMARVDALVRDALADFTGADPHVGVATGTDHPDAERIPAEHTPDGMSAGSGTPVPAGSVTEQTTDTTTDTTTVTPAA